MLNLDYNKRTNQCTIIYNTGAGVCKETFKFKPLMVVDDPEGIYTNLEGNTHYSILSEDLEANGDYMYSCLYSDKYNRPDYYLNTILQIPEETLTQIQTPELLFYDIETNEFASSDKGEDKGRITSIAFIHNGNEHVLVKDVDGTEREILNTFFKYCKNNDIMGLVGFNSYEFDNQVLFNRCHQLNVDTGNLSKYTNCNIDVMVLARVFQYVPKGQYISLENLALKLNLNEGKKDTGYHNPVTLYYEALDNPEAMEQFTEYNIQDVRLTVKCFEAMESEQQLNELFKQTLTPYNKVQYNSILLNSYTCKEAMADRKVINKPLNKPVEFKNNGGFNYYIETDELQTYHNVCVFDIVSYYPHLLQLIGADPTYEYSNVNRTTGDIGKFGTIPDGYLAKLSKDLYESRAKTKQERDKHDKRTEAYKKLDYEQKTKKIIVNSLYGVLNQKGNYYILKNELLGATITAIGRNLLNHIIQEFKGVYGKTDSIFIPTLHLVPDVLVEIINDEVNEYLKTRYNLENKTKDGQLIRFEIDDLLETFIVKDKNNYVKISEETGEITLKGSTFNNSRMSEFEEELTLAILDEVEAGHDKDTIILNMERFTQNRLDDQYPLDYYSYTMGLSEKQKDQLKHSGRTYMDIHNIQYFYGFKYYACRVVGFQQDYIMYPEGYKVKDYELYKPFAFEQMANRLSETKIISKKEADNLKKLHNVRKAKNHKPDEAQTRIFTPIKRSLW